MKKTIAFCGTRGIPANYGGFETAVDRISNRLAEQGVECHIFCRTDHTKDSEIISGRKAIYIKGSSSRKLDTFISSINTGLYLWRNRKQYDYVFWFNNANLPGIIMTLLSGIPTAVNTDGLEWKRAKWSWPFKVYYFLSSLLISIICKTLISDSISIQEYYKKVFRKTTQFIPYGSPEIYVADKEQKKIILKKYNLEANKYFLQVTRFEPDNLPLEIIKKFIESRVNNLGYKFVLIGYKDETPYTLEIKKLDNKDGIIVLNANYDNIELAVLRSEAHCYVHGNSVGGTNPALLEAMAYCKRILAIEGPFSQEVLEENGLKFSSSLLPQIINESLSMADQSIQMKERLFTYYRWDAVSDAYYDLVIRNKTNYYKNLVRKVPYNIASN